jgi:fatty-acyl-CoA synthase
MAAVQLRPGVDALEPAALSEFLAAQGDLGTKWAPRFVRLSPALPITATNKVLKRALRAERWNCAEPVLWQPEKGGGYAVLSADEARSLEASVGDRVL